MTAEPVLQLFKVSRRELRCLADRQALVKSENDKRMWMAHQTQQIIINRLQEGDGREQTCSAREHPGGELVCLVGFFWGKVDLKENR